MDGAPPPERSLTGAPLRDERGVWALACLYIPHGCAFASSEQPPGTPPARMQALIKPRLNIAARPYPAPGMLRIALGPGIFALITGASRAQGHCEPAIRRDRTGRNGPSVLIQ